MLELEINFILPVDYILYTNLKNLMEFDITIIKKLVIFTTIIVLCLIFVLKIVTNLWKLYKLKIKTKY